MTIRDMAVLRDLAEAETIEELEEHWEQVVSSYWWKWYRQPTQFRGVPASVDMHSNNYARYFLVLVALTVVVGIAAIASFVVLIIQVFGGLSDIPVAISLTVAYAATALTWMNLRLVMLARPQLTMRWRQQSLFSQN